MSEVHAYAPGTFSWIDLGTTDPDQAKRFYSELFGWEVNDMPMGDGTFYTMFQVGGRDVSALYGLSREQREQGVSPHWLSYVTVTSVDEAAARAGALGGTVLSGPHDVFDAGRMAVVQDPTGAPFALWQAGTHIGASRIGEPGTLCWNELATRDADAAEAFYTNLFAWSTKKENMGDLGTYTVFADGDRQAGGMYQLNGEMAGMPSHWTVYIAVDDCDARTERARALGADVRVPPMDIPNVGRFALLQDPQGAVFAIIKLIPA